jgi:hypothetical protein
MESTIRRPAVAGRFYPGDPNSLLADVRSYLAPPKKTLSAIGCVVPHAGYIYSGHVAGAVFARLRIARRCIVLCPNHTGLGQPLAIMSAGAWETPLGKVRIDSSLANALKQHFPPLTEDADAHRAEHAADHAGKRPQSHRANFGLGRSRIIRRRDERRHQHVRLWADRHNADCRQGAGCNGSGTRQIRYIRRCFW